MLTIVLAAVLGLFGVVAVFAYAHQANQRALVGQNPEKVLVANAAIPAGTSLNQARQQHLVSSEKVPAKSLSTPVVQSTTDGKLVMNAPVAPGQVLLLNMVGPPGSATSSSFVVPIGYAAVTVDMCIAEAVAGYLVPGSKVAIFDTVTPVSFERTCGASHQALSLAQLQKSGTAVVVQEAQVLAVGPSPVAQGTSASTNVAVNTDPSSSSSGSANTEVLVTLALKQVNAERVMDIAEVGLPYIALLGQGANMTLTPPPHLFQFSQQP
jgi:pilus assembly protein CpaB